MTTVCPPIYTIDNLLLQYNFYCNIELPLTGNVRILYGGGLLHDAANATVGSWTILEGPRPTLAITDFVADIGEFKVFMPLVAIPDRPGSYYLRSITPGTTQSVAGATYTYTAQLWEPDFIISSTGNVYIPYVSSVTPVTPVVCSC